MQANLEEIVSRYSYDPESGDIEAIDTGRRGRKAKGFLYNGHMVTRMGSRHIKMADIAWAYVYNRWPHDTLTYKDGNPTNLSLDNLAEPELAPEAPVPEYRGVRRVGANKFRAQTRLPDESGKNTKVAYLGTYATPEEARDAVITAESAAGKTYERRPPKMGRPEA